MLAILHTVLLICKILLHNASWWIALSNVGQLKSLFFTNQPIPALFPTIFKAPPNAILDHFSKPLYSMTADTKYYKCLKLQLSELFFMNSKIFIDSVDANEKLIDTTYIGAFVQCRLKHLHWRIFTLLRNVFTKIKKCSGSSCGISGNSFAWEFFIMTLDAWPQPRLQPSDW